MNSNFLMDNRCFACGRDNPIGLHLEITDTETGVCAPLNLSSSFQGYQKVIHGGIISTVLDEMAVWAAYKKGYRAVTAELCMRIKKPMLAETGYVARGEVLTVKYKLIIARAEIRDQCNEVIATADVKLIKID